MIVECIGWLECTCRACLIRKREALSHHAEHAATGERDLYCGACTTHARHAANGETNLSCSVCVAALARKARK